MRTALLMMLVSALAFSAVAVAGNGPGKPDKTRPDRPTHCKHGHVALKGTFMVAATDSFTMNVLKANRHGRALKGEQTVDVNDNTKLRRKGKEGKAALADLVKGDRLHVLARCKPGDTAGSFTLLAKLVWARPAKPANTSADSG